MDTQPGSGAGEVKLPREDIARATALGSTAALVSVLTPARVLDTYEDRRI